MIDTYIDVEWLQLKLCLMDTNANVVNMSGFQERKMELCRSLALNANHLIGILQERIKIDVSIILSPYIHKFNIIFNPRNV